MGPGVGMGMMIAVARCVRLGFGLRDAKGVRSGVGTEVVIEICLRVMKRGGDWGVGTGV